MDNFIVSARKYRPDTFDSVVGQKTLTTTLRNSVKTGRLGHAYLFCGPRGVGKTTCARIFAKSINCLNPTAEGNPCNQCESCMAFNEQRSLNIHELDAASNNSIDDIRGIIEQVRIPPQIGRYKVFIVDEVHMLSTAAFNAFLKTLEEPPEHVIFVLATTEKYKLLPTIISRCQIFDFARIEPSDIVDHLSYVAQSEGVEAEHEALSVIARKADGGMRDALSMFDQIVSFTNGHLTYARVIENLNVLDYEYYFRLTDMLLSSDVPQSLLLFDEILKKGFDGSHFIGGLAAHFRSLLVSRDEATLPLLEVSKEVSSRYAEQASCCPIAYLYKSIKLCNDCDLNYRVSKNKRLLVELTLIQLAQLAQGDEVLPQGGNGTATIKPMQKAGSATNATNSAITGNAPTARPTAQRQVSAGNKPMGDSAPQAGQNAKTNAAAAPTSSAQPTPKIAIAKSSQPKATTLKVASVLSSMPTNRGQDNSASELKEETGATNDCNKAFTENDLNSAWFRYAMQLPKEEGALASIIKNAKLKSLSSESFAVEAENPLVKEHLEKQRPDILQYLQKELQNNKIKMEVQLIEASLLKEKSEAATPEGIYKQLLKNSQPIRNLVEGLGLELT